MYDRVELRGWREGRKVKRKNFFYKNPNREDITFFCGGSDFTLTGGRFLNISSLSSAELVLRKQDVMGFSD